MLYALQAGCQKFGGDMPGGMMENGRRMMERQEMFTQGGGPMFIMHGIFAALFGIALLVIVVIAAVWLYRLMKKHTEGYSGKRTVAESAMEILQRRYAEGAIGTEEYLERKSNLTQ